MKKPKAELEIREGEKIVIWSVFEFLGEEHRVKHEIYARTHGYLHIERYGPNHG